MSRQRWWLPVFWKISRQRQGAHLGDISFMLVLPNFTLHPQKIFNFFWFLNDFCYLHSKKSSLMIPHTYVDLASNITETLRICWPPRISHLAESPLLAIYCNVYIRWLFDNWIRWLLRAEAAGGLVAIRWLYLLSGGFLLMTDPAITDISDVLRSTKSCRETLMMWR